LSNLTLDVYLVPVAGVMGRIVENNEAVLVLPDKGEIKVLNEVGARIWSLADGSRTVRTIAASICDEFAVDLTTAEADTLAFASDLIERGILCLAEQAQ
jgi:hypothetical protein